MTNTPAAVEPLPNVIEQTVPLCRAPIFIIGAPRSRTTILADALAQHSDLWGSGESDIWLYLYHPRIVDEAFERARSRPYGWFAEQDVERTELLRYLGLGVNALYTSRSGGRRWVEQTPHYTPMAEVLAGMFPDALFIHILRDGREVVHSMVNFLKSCKPEVAAQLAAGGFLAPWVNDFRRACQAWRKHVDAAAAFVATHPNRSITVLSEQVAAEPETTFSALFDFLGIPSEEGPARYIRGRRYNSSFRDTARGGEAASAWEEWSREDQAIFLAEVGRVMVEHGFMTLAELKDLSARLERHGETVEIPDSELYLLRRDTIRRAMRETIPTGQTVAVVSRGDDRLLELPDFQALHFPSGEDGTYSGNYPADDGDAIGRLDAVRRAGVSYLVFPFTALWWLDHYAGLRRYLDDIGEIVFGDQELCVIYRLRELAELPATRP
jgi:hypothetical protein